MSDYQIHTVVGDEPYVTMHGDFSADKLHEILEEMLAEKAARQSVRWTADPSDAMREFCEAAQKVADEIIEERRR